MVTPADYVRTNRFLMKTHPQFTEAWVQDLIAADPSILGLGDLVLRDKERSQPRAGRLDLLLENSEDKERFEVEVQLGATDESHIIRTIEYWDLERKRYPQYEHCAVIIAEEITGRFLNVISLFNGAIPLIALQVQAFEVHGKASLIFTKVLDRIKPEIDVPMLNVNRNYWEARSSKDVMRCVDDLLKSVKILDNGLDLKYNQSYIGLSKNSQPYNFLSMRPRRSTINIEFRIPQNEEINQKVESSGVVSLGYSDRWGLYRIAVQPDDFAKHGSFINEMVGLAYQHRSS